MAPAKLATSGKAAVVLLFSFPAACRRRRLDYHLMTSSPKRSPKSTSADVASTADIIDLDAYRARRQQRVTGMRAAPEGAGQAVPALWAWWIWPAFVWVPVPVGSIAPAWERG